MRVIRASLGNLAALMMMATVSFFSGCKKEPEKAVVLAQVGNSTLTLEELRESFPPELEQLIRREQYLDFIKRWMDDEAVFQQALKAKIESDPLVGRKLEKLRRKVLIEEYMARENATEVFEPDELAMNQYYEMHKEDFRRKSPEVKFAQMRVQTVKQAADLRSKANRGDFLAVAAASSLDPVPESYSSIAFKKQSEFPPCLSQDIASTGIGAVTLPVACPDGYYLVKVIERQDAGSLVSFAEAKEEISGILVMERKDELMDGKIAKYKEGQIVSYNLDKIPGLAESTKGMDGSSPASSDQNAAPAVVPASSTPAAAGKPPGRPAVAASPPPTEAPAQPKPVAYTPSAAPAQPKPDAPAASAAPVQPKPAAPPAQDPRLPREPDFITAAQGSASGAPAGSLAPSSSAPEKPKLPNRKHVPKPRTADSSDSKAPDTTPETLGQKPTAEENINAQSPISTP
ncbi:MAG: peptidyl-prolyl cis-trans isomerase [Fibrobacteria bacterium]